MFLCTVEALLNGYSLEGIANLFIKWYQEGDWTAHGKVFDIGNTTKMALKRLSYMSPKSRDYRMNIAMGMDL